MAHSPLRVGTLADSRILNGPFEERRQLLARAADRGLDHVFMADHVSFHTGAGMDGLIQAAIAASLEPTLGVYVGVYLLALRHPAPVARQIATLCEAAPGRLTMGIGVGGEDRHEIEVCGVDPATRGRRTTEHLEAVRALLTGEPVDFRGEFVSLENAQIVPAPDPPVPFTVGGRADAALTRAGRLGDGWLGVWTSAERYAAAVRQVEEEAARAGRTDVAWRHGLQVWIGVDDDRERARARLARGMEDFYHVPYARFEKYSPYGSAEEIAEYLAAYRAAGCADFNVMAVAEDTEAAIEAVAVVRERLAEI